MFNVLSLSVWFSLKALFYSVHKFELGFNWAKLGDTVDGRHPAPVDMVNIPLITRFHACWVVSRISSITSSFIFYVAPTRWAPTSYKWRYNLYKWPYKWVTGVITLHMGVITPYITGFLGPPCRWGNDSDFRCGAMLEVVGQVPPRPTSRDPEVEVWTFSSVKGCQKEIERKHVFFGCLKHTFFSSKRGWFIYVHIYLYTYMYIHLYGF